MSVNVPKKLKHLFSEGRIRRSTGTSDRAIAEQRAIADIVPMIERELAQAETKLDPFVEGLRSLLEREGVTVSTWYTHGFIKQTMSFSQLEPEVTATAEFEQTKQFLANFGPTMEVSDYRGLCILVAKLGYTVPESLAQYLPDDVRSKLLDEMANPRNLHDFVQQVGRERPHILGTNLGKALLKNATNPTPIIKIGSDASDMPMFSDWSKRYIEDKKAKDSRDVHQKRIRACEMFLKVCGDKPLDAYDKAHAVDMARYMDKDPDKEWGNSTIKTYYSNVRQAFIYAGEVRNDAGDIILKSHPFHDVRLSEFGVAKVRYQPFTEEELYHLFTLEMGEQERLLLSILVTTGMRLDEVALLTWERIVERENILCFDLTEDDAVVKNQGSRRLVPVPDVLKPLLPTRGTGRLFDYRLDATGKAENAASKKIMPLIRKVTMKKTKVAHSLRGTLKDLLRNADVTKEVNDFLTGHSQGDVAGSYGSGPSLKTRLAALNKIEHAWITSN